jgi:hypothetical protein
MRGSDDRLFPRANFRREKINNSKGCVKNCSLITPIAGSKSNSELKSTIKARERAGVGESSTTGNGYDVKGSRDEQLESLTFSAAAAAAAARTFPTDKPTSTSLGG